MIQLEIFAKKIGISQTNLNLTTLLNSSSIKIKINVNCKDYPIEEKNKLIDIFGRSLNEIGSCIPFQFPVIFFIDLDLIVCVFFYYACNWIKRFNVKLCFNWDTRDANDDASNIIANAYWVCIYTSIGMNNIPDVTMRCNAVHFDLKTINFENRTSLICCCGCAAVLLPLHMIRSITQQHFLIIVHSFHLFTFFRHSRWSKPAVWFEPEKCNASKHTIRRHESEWGRERETENVFNSLHLSITIDSTFR